MNRLALLLLAALYAHAADRVFEGRVERLTAKSISLRMAEGQEVDAALPAGTIVPYHAGDRVEIACAPLKTRYDGETRLHLHLQLLRIRLLRAADARPEPSLAGPAPDFEQIRKVNLGYIEKLPDFVADETLRVYESGDTGKPWELERTQESEIRLHDGRLDRQAVRVNGKPVKHADKLTGDFGALLAAVFNPDGPYQFDFAGREEDGGRPVLLYDLRCPVDGCGIGVNRNGQVHKPAMTGRAVLDAATGRELNCAWDSVEFPEKYSVDRLQVTDRWAEAKISGTAYLVAASMETLVRLSDGSMKRIFTAYTNYRHFEASTNVTFH